MPRLKRSLLGVRVSIDRMIAPVTAGERERGAAIPRRAGEGRIQDPRLTVQHDHEIPVDIHEPIIRDHVGDRGPEQLPGAIVIQPIDAMNDLRLVLGKRSPSTSARNRCFVEQVPRRSRSIPPTVRSRGRPSGRLRTASTNSTSDEEGHDSASVNDAEIGPTLTLRTRRLAEARSS